MITHDLGVIAETVPSSGMYVGEIVEEASARLCRALTIRTPRNDERDAQMSESRERLNGIQERFLPLRLRGLRVPLSGSVVRILERCEQGFSSYEISQPQSRCI